NASELFYGICMLDKFKGIGKKKYYLIYGMCDETFVINSTEKAPAHINSGWFMFYVTVLNQLYWVGGTTIGSLFGSAVTFNTEGLEFVMRSEERRVGKECSAEGGSAHYKTRGADRGRDS